jgi:hypothetical protein
MRYSAGQTEVRQSQQDSPTGLKSCIRWLEFRQVTAEFCVLVRYPWEGSSSNTMWQPLLRFLSCWITKLTAYSESNTVVWVTKHLHSDEMNFSDCPLLSFLCDIWRIFTATRMKFVSTWSSTVYDVHQDCILASHSTITPSFNLSKPTGYVMHQQV